MKKIQLIIFIFLFLQAQVFAHSGKPKYHLIIDTDGAIDDMRSISMFLAGNEIRVLAITCSQGTLSPNSCSIKVNSLLKKYYHQGIPVGISDTINFPLPVWNSFAEQINWGFTNNQDNQIFTNSIDLLNQTIKNYPYLITLIALGSLKTYADWIKNNPDIKTKIERIIWYNNFEKENGFNYLVDTLSYNFIVKSGIPLEIISNNRNDLIIDNEYLTYLQNTNTVYAQQIFFVHQQKPVLEKVKQNHLQLWDDLIPLYLLTPVLFDIEKKEDITYVNISNSIPKDYVYQTIAQILISGTATNNRVFNSFPIDPNLYKNEYVDILNTTIEKYGLVEWKAIVLTNEVHGHTGIYSIIGAKMGIRALEYFNVGVNNLMVTTFVGLEPPLSCLNDGIQISTGATIGQGLITVSDTVKKIPTVIFEFNNHKIKISLKPQISEQIQNDIKIGVQKYGFTDQYWIYIEELAIKYWADYDRHEIFNIEKL